MRPRTLLPFCVLVALALSGCSQDDPTSPKTPYWKEYSPQLFAVTVPESVAAGDSVEILVHIFSPDGCHSPKSIRLDTLGPRHLKVTVRAQERVHGVCTAIAYFPAMVARTRLDAPGTWTIDVAGEDTASVSIEVGVAPMRGGVHKFRVEPRSGTALPDFVDIWWHNPVPLRDTVAVDASGKGEYELLCGLDLSRILHVPSTGSAFGFDANPEECTYNVTTRIFR